MKQVPTQNPLPADLRGLAEHAGGVQGRGWLSAVLIGAAVFVVGVVLQLTGLPHVGLAVSMVGALVLSVGGLLRPRRPR